MCEDSGRVNMTHIRCPWPRLAVGIYSSLAVVMINLAAQAPATGQRRATIAITLIGTGAGPTVDSTRAGPSTLVEAGDERLLFDAGREATTQLARAGIPFGAVKTVVLTHLHSDHIVGLSDLFLSPWGARGGSSRSRWP